MNILSLPLSQAVLLFFLSFGLIAWGQPSSASWIGVIAASLGYACYFRIQISQQSYRSKFALGVIWYGATQLVQTFWMTSHPYSYIYAVYFGFALLWGIEWGLFSLLLTAERFKSSIQIFFLASLWTLCEWSRLYFLSGYSWNPAGLALTTNTYSLQFASIGGIFALSFWIVLTNAFALKGWLELPKKRGVAIWSCLALLPYLFGFFHFSIHKRERDAEEGVIRAVLVQPAFPAEEALSLNSKEEYVALVLQEWEKILSITKKHLEKEIDIIALPEYVVPLGTYTYVYPHSIVEESFVSIFGEGAKEKLPDLASPFAKKYDTEFGPHFFVNNAFWAQGMANIFGAELIAGLEDREQDREGNWQFFSAALHFKPTASFSDYIPVRYSKRVLLPMAEYIPFSFFKKFAALYGIQSSFTPGEGTVLMECGTHQFAASICYEETFGDLMRENRVAGANLLINLTSDVWYPNSSLPQRHRDHARLRSVENGIPLLRACNTGITCAFDSIGNSISQLGDGSPQWEWVSDSLYVEVPAYHYKTAYALFGDRFILGICGIGFLTAFWSRSRTKSPSSRKRDLNK